MNYKVVTTAAALLVATAGVTVAGGHGGGPFDQAIKARQAPMTIMAFNLGILGGMAKGEVEYDSATASQAAANILSAASINQPTAWPAGSDNSSVEGTRALPAIWENFPGVVAEIDALKAAATTLSQVAGNDLDSLRGAIGGVGKSCGSCHEKFRAENN